MKTLYVAGLMFRRSPTNHDELQVALVLKDHPEWQAGKLNGIGGHIEGDEMPLDAMIREFSEETGSETNERDWREFCLLGGLGWSVHWFVCLVGDGKTLITNEKEAIGWVPLWQILDQTPPADPRLRFQIIPNLRWLIPLALDKDKVFAVVQDPSTL